MEGPAPVTSLWQLRCSHQFRLKRIKAILKVVKHLKKSKYPLAIFSRTSKTTELYLINKYTKLTRIYHQFELLRVCLFFLESSLRGLCRQSFVLKNVIFTDLSPIHIVGLSPSTYWALKRCPDCRKKCSNKGKMLSFLPCPSTVLKKLKFNSAKRINLQNLLHINYHVFNFTAVPFPFLIDHHHLFLLLSFKHSASGSSSVPDDP